MLRRDYIVQMIEEFGIIWARLIEQLRTGQSQQARITLDLAYVRLFGLRSEDVVRLSAGDLLARLHLGHEPEAAHTRCRLMSALIRNEAALARRTNQPQQAQMLYDTALSLTATLDRMYPDLAPPVYAPTVVELEAEKREDE